MQNPLDRSSDIHPELVRSLSPGVIAARWQEEYGVEVGADFESLPAIEHWRCPETGFEWFTPPTAAGAAGFYSQLQHLESYYSTDKWEFHQALRQLSGKGRVLEIGSGVGHFLRLARHRGLDVAGVELNPAAASVAEGDGFTIYQERLEALADRMGPTFDAVCAFQVLEHVPDPYSFIQAMIRLLRPGGKLLISVPNLAVSRVIDPEHRRMFDEPPHHMSRWDERVFRNLERLFPVMVISVAREPLQSHHVSWFVAAVGGQIRRALGTASGRLLVNRYSLASVRWLLQLGGRKWIPGHTLFVVLQNRTPLN